MKGTVLFAALMWLFIVPCNAQLTGEETNIDVSQFADQNITGNKWEYSDRILKVKSNTITLSGTNNSIAIESANSNVVLKLNNLHITGLNVEGYQSFYKGSSAIFTRTASVTLNIEVAAGTVNTITGGGTSGIYSDGNIALTGTGTLNTHGGTYGYYGSYGLDIWGSCLIDGPKVLSKGTSEESKGHEGMCMNGGTIDIQAGSLTVTATRSHYQYALSDNGKNLAINVQTGASFTISNLGTGQNTTVNNHGGDVYIDGNVPGTANNHSGTFTVTGTVSNSTGEITFDYGKAEIDLNNPGNLPEGVAVVTGSEIEHGKAYEGLQLIEITIKKQYTITGSAPDHVLYDKKECPLLLQNATLRGIYCKTIFIGIEGENNIGNAGIQNNASIITLSGIGTLTVTGDASSIVKYGIGVHDVNVTINGAHIKVSGFKFAMNNLTVKSGTVEIEGPIEYYTRSEGGSLTIQGSSNLVYNTGEGAILAYGNATNVEHTGAGTTIVYGEVNEFENSMKVTLDPQGGSAMPPIYLSLTMRGVPFGAPLEVPVLEGKAFAGWYKESECVNAWTFETDAVTNNTTLYAKYTYDVGVTDPVVNSGIALYPNPVKDILHIETGNNMVSKVKVYSINGILMLTTESKQVNLSGFAKGMYILKLTTAQGEVVKKVMKQ